MPDRQVKRIIQDPRTTCEEILKDLETAGIIVAKKSNSLNHHGLLALWLCKNPLLKKHHDLKFAEKYLDKPVKY